MNHTLASKTILEIRWTTARPTRNEDTVAASGADFTALAAERLRNSLRWGDTQAMRYVWGIPDKDSGMSWYGTVCKS